MDECQPLAVGVTPANVNKEVIYGDFGDVPLEHLSAGSYTRPLLSST